MTHKLKGVNVPHYKLTSPSGKSYHGITTLTVNRRMTGHKTAARNGSQYPIHAAIRKYGFDKLKLEVLSESVDIEELHAMEVAAIARDNTLSPSGYNLTSGGEGTTGHSVSSEVREKLGNLLRERWKNPEFAEMKRKNSSETALKLSLIPGRAEKFIRIASEYTSNPANIAARTLRTAELRASDPERFRRHIAALIAYNKSDAGRKRSAEAARKLRASQSPEKRKAIAMTAVKKREENRIAREAYLNSLPAEEAKRLRAEATAKKSAETKAGRARATPEQKEASRERYRQAAIRRNAAKKVAIS